MEATLDDEESERRTRGSKRHDAAHPRASSTSDPPVQALESLADMAHRSEEGSLSYELTRLFASGIETFHDLRDRIERCEEALDEARDLGLIGDHPEKSPTKPRPDGD